ncbi:hypothetical protein EV359DRAFT_63768 [Lentinula novae-zelandiae]|nr:hypothetical protein EV359DRAFT_63768 [Lentinula novae-zelandiae]
MNLASSPELASNRAGPSKGKQRAHPSVSSHGRTRVTRAMSRSNALPGDLDPTALNNIPEEDEPQDWGASPSPARRSHVVGTPEHDMLDGVGHTRSLGHTDSHFGCPTARLGPPRLTIKLPGTLPTGRSASSRRLPTLASPGLAGAVNPLRRLLSPVATSTPRLSHAGNASMRIQALLNSVPRYPTAVASSRSGNSVGSASSHGVASSHRGRSRVDISISHLLSGAVARSRRASRSPDGAPPLNRQRTHSTPPSSPSFAPLLPPFQSPGPTIYDHDVLPLLHSNHRRSSRSASGQQPRITLTTPHHQLTSYELRRPHSPGQHGHRAERRIGTSTVALPDPSEQDHTMAVSQTVRILPEVISALRKGWPEHISIAYFNPKMVCSNPANRRRTDNTVSLSGTDLRIKSKDLSHFDLARVSTDDFGEIAKTMPKALEAFLITEKSHGRTGSEHALAIADFVRRTFQMVTNRDDYLECFPAYLIYTEQVLFDWKNNPKQRGVPFVFNEPRWSRIERGVRSRSDWLLAYYTFQSTEHNTTKAKPTSSFRETSSMYLR